MSNNVLMIVAGFGLVASVALFAIRSVPDELQEWPRDNDVYHSQIILPPKDGQPPRGAYFVDEKTMEILPQVCDTYGDGRTVCRQGSFGPAPTVAQERQRIVDAKAKGAAEDKRRALQKQITERMAKLGRYPVYSWANGQQNVEYLSREQIDNKFRITCPPSKGKTCD